MVREWECEKKFRNENTIFYGGREGPCHSAILPFFHSIAWYIAVLTVMSDSIADLNSWSTEVTMCLPWQIAQHTGRPLSNSRMVLIMIMYHHSTTNVSRILTKRVIVWKILEEILLILNNPPYNHSRLQMMYIVYYLSIIGYIVCMRYVVTIQRDIFILCKYGRYVYRLKLLSNELWINFWPWQHEKISRKAKSHHENWTPGLLVNHNST